MRVRRSWVAVVATLGTLSFVSSANGATLSVDDDGGECPTAQYDSVQDAIDAAATGDTVSICPGTYIEGTGASATNAITITKNLTIRGAGADLVTISPRRTTSTGGQIAANSPVTRDGVGNIASIVGGSAVPITVNISGVTFDGNGVYSEIGVLFLDAQGSLTRSRVTDVVTSEDAAAFNFPGGYRSNNLGYGVAQMTGATTAPPGAQPRPLLIDASRIDKYNKIGVLIDGATQDTPPLTASGVVNAGTIRGTSIVGRTLCIDFKATGNCRTVGLLTQGPTFGQDGLRVTAGATAAVSDTIATQNLVLGTGAPTRNSATNNANLVQGSGARFVGAGTSTIANSNVVDNAYGVQNLQLDGTTASATPLSAENNWWGLRYTGVTNNVGPAISPTTNPQVPENPVNGTATADPTCLSTNGTPVSNSTAVDFCPFRNGSQGDPNSGEYPVVNSPLPVNDAGPSVSLDADDTQYAPGDTVTLTATASDDFGVKNVAFLEGDTALNIDTTTPYQYSFVIPVTGPCGERTFTALAKDSASQTASDSVTVTVVDANNCVAPSDPPEVELTNPPETLAQEGANIFATATADAGVDNVEFFLGNRSVCVDETEPYSCAILPQGDEVGDQILRVVVTDNEGQTAEDSSLVTVDRFEPVDLTIEMDKVRINKNRVTRTISGEVVLPQRVTAAQGCSSGTVTLNVQRNGITLFPSSQVELSDDCSYSLEFTINEPKKKKNGKKRKYTYDVAASFSGNTVLKPTSATGRYSR